MYTGSVAFRHDPKAAQGIWVRVALEKKIVKQNMFSLILLGVSW